jgi:hypothetical protein
VATIRWYDLRHRKPDRNPKKQAALLFLSCPISGPPRRDAVSAVSNALANAVGNCVVDLRHAYDFQHGPRLNLVMTVVGRTLDMNSPNLCHRKGMTMRLGPIVPRTSRPPWNPSSSTRRRVSRATSMLFSACVTTKHGLEGLTNVVAKKGQPTGSAPM